MLSGVRLAQHTGRHRFGQFASRCVTTNAGSEDLYEALEVKSTATSEEIKLAFRKKAKIYHPDVSQASAFKFSHVLRAYQVLIDPQQRRLYDLQQDSGRPELVRKAAQSRREHGGQDHPEWEWMPHLRSDKPEHQHNQLDRIRAQLHVEFKEAVLHAYHGPYVDLAAQQLPQCFEAEERSDLSAHDILQLVSGRQLLGFVRERVTPLLDDSVRHHAQVAAEAAQRQLEHVPCQHTANSEQQQHLRMSQSSTQHKRESHCSGPRWSNVAGRQNGASSITQRRVLELWVDEEQVATGLQQTLRNGKRILQVFSNQGQLLYEELSGAIRTSAGRQQTHRTFTSQTPFVKALDFVAMERATGLKQDRVVCRCKRAWLPPPATWLFPPRTPTHSSGGWYFEWVGYEQSDHPAWLSPHALVLRVAFETLRTEAESQEHASKKPSRTGAALSWMKSKLRV